MSSQRPVSPQVRNSQNYVWNRLDVLGHGATCEVFKAYHKTTGEPAAVKVFNKAGISRDMYQQQRELQLVQKLEHKNLVKVLAIEEEDDVSVSRSIVVMELCEGRSLFSFLSLPENRHGLQDKEFLTVFNDVTEGIKYLRENHVVHRDIKPGNIMRCIKEDGSSMYKLTDFGGARELEEDAVFMSLHGTEEYLHPDIYEKALVDRRAPANFRAEVDLWSLGATFFHSAAGQTPFKTFHGRGDKVTMLKMTKSKDTGVISGIQKTKDGEITYSKELPSKAPMSAELKKIIEPVLGRLLERIDNKAMSFDEYFDCVSSIKEMISIKLLNVPECMTHTVYIKPDCSFNEFKKSVENACGILPADQFLLTERYIDIEHLEKNFMRYGELYVLSKSESDMDVTFKSAPLTYTRFSKNASDLIQYDCSLSMAMCIEAYQYSQGLDRCILHSNLVSHAVQSLIDYCEDSPNRLEVNMSVLTAKSQNLEARRKDILTTNEAFIKILDLLAEIFQKIDSGTVNNICKLSNKTLQQFKSVLSNHLIGAICNKLHLPCVLDFDRFLNSIEVVDLKLVIQVLYEIQDEALKDFLQNCLAAEVPVTYIVSLLEMYKSNLSLWAKQKICSGSSIDEQLHTLHSKIKEIQANSSGIDGKIGEVTVRSGELSNIMNNVLSNMMKINEQFEMDKKQKVRVTSTIKIMHQLNRNYLETLKRRAFDVASEAVEGCNKINKCLKPRVEEFLTLQEILRKYRLEYKQDFDMLSEYENNLEQWRSHMFESVSELASHITSISLPVLESNEMKTELMSRITEFEETNKRNKKLVEENTSMLRKLLDLCNYNLNS
ncbi:serine/threonine-protein kinase TBK1-like [Bolinopsis microptera]|uniref:serine/threonine-protein kinase TBK1-like n=1 Tax=Bolinopsis microptera TaxID=2820187 RepID=UPI0030790AFF